MTIPIPGVDELPFKLPPQYGKPPSWWYPKSDPGFSGLSATQPTRTTQILIPPSDPSPADPQAGPGSPPPAPARTRMLAIASGIAGAAILAVGLFLWVRPFDSSPASHGPSAVAVPPTKGGSPPPGSPGTAGGKAVNEPGPPSPPPPPPGPSTRLQILVPAYIYPAGQENLKEWDRLIDAASRAPIVAVVNPNSGPGEAENPDYAAVISRAVRRGVTVVGYVGTDYGKRPRAEAEADVDRWVDFYPEIRGIFFDAQAADPEHVDHYMALRDYARSKIRKALVVTNPGTLCAEGYLSRPVADLLCIFEGPTGFDKLRLPAWAARPSGGRLAALPYQVEGPDRMRDCIQLASSRGFGAICVSDAGVPNRWDRLPSYWDDEVEAVHRVNQQEAP